MSEKSCTKCGETKPLEEFHRDRRSRDGRMGYCKACNNERARVWRKANPERAAAAVNAWYEDNRERHAETSRAWRIANPERTAKINRAIAVRMRAKYPEKHAARRAVNNAIRAGKLPAASTQVCVACGDDAQNWHHHLGYAPEHWLDVVAVCIPCHVELDKETS